MKTYFASACVVGLGLFARNASAASSTVQMQPRSSPLSSFGWLDKTVRCNEIGKQIDGALDGLTSQKTGELTTEAWTSSGGRVFNFNYLPWKIRGTLVPDGEAALHTTFASSASKGQVWVSRISKWGSDRIGVRSTPDERGINFSLQKVSGYKTSSTWGAYTTVGDIYVVACAFEVSGKTTRLRREYGAIIRSRGDMRTGFGALSGYDVSKGEFILAIAAWMQPANSYVTSKLESTGPLSVQLVVDHLGH